MSANSLVFAIAITTANNWNPIKDELNIETGRDLSLSSNGLISFSGSRRKFLMLKTALKKTKTHTILFNRALDSFLVLD